LIRVPGLVYNGGMKERRESLIPIPPDWKPASLARTIEREVEKWWDEGWVFLNAETDALMESVCLFFERPIIGENGEDPPYPSPGIRD
jgi:hypothetical protein